MENLLRQQPGRRREQSGTTQAKRFEPEVELVTRRTAKLAGTEKPAGRKRDNGSTGHIVCSLQRRRHTFQLVCIHCEAVTRCRTIGHGHGNGMRRGSKGVLHGSTILRGRVEVGKPHEIAHDNGKRLATGREHLKLIAFRKAIPATHLHLPQTARRGRPSQRP